MARILVAEDEDSIRYLVQTLLRHCGHEVMAVVNGSAALDVLEHDAAFDVVMTDMRMPEINGIELIQAIKGNFPWLSVIAMSVYEEQLIHAQESGADSCLRKPFDYRQLRESIHSLMQATVL